MSVQLGSIYGRLGVDHSGYTRGLQAAQKETSKFGSFVSRTLSTALGQVAAQAATKALAGIVSLGKAMIMNAARVEEMSLVLHTLGRNAGITATQMDQYVASVKAMGIRTDVSQGLVAKFLRANLDMAKASDLARVAQDSAVISMQDSSKALQQLVHGITTGNVRVLRNAGIMLNAVEVYKKFAAENNLVASSLTATQKQAAMLNAVIAAGSQVFGAYEAAMRSPGKMLRSLPRYLYEITLSMGEPFQQAFGTAVFSVTRLVKTFREMVEEGGVLNPVLQRMGAVASLVADVFGNFVRRLTITREEMQDTAIMSQRMGRDMERIGVTARDAGENFLSNLVRKLSESAMAALKWGSNIVAELAKGMVRGAAGVLSTAMRFIGGLLSGQMAGRSPPKFASDLPKWGANAFTEFLRGFGNAEFDVLESLQGPLRAALGALATIGDIAEESVGKTYVMLSRQVTGVLDTFRKTGEMNIAIYDQLRKSGGQFGDALADLLKKQVALYSATKDAEAAQEELNEAQQAERDYEALTSQLQSLRAEYEQMAQAGQEQAEGERETAQAQIDSVNELRAEYRALQAAGADPKVLQAKMQEIRAAQKAATASRKTHQDTVKQNKESLAAKEEEISATEEAVDTAKLESEAATEKVRLAREAYEAAQEELDAKREQASLQNKIVQQMIAMAEAEHVAVEEAEALEEALSGAASITPELDTAALTEPLGNLQDELFTQMDVLKEQLKTQLGTAFAPLKTAWEEDIYPTLTGLQTRWGEFTATAKKFYDERIAPLITGLKGLIPPSVLEHIGTAIGIVGVLAVAFSVLSTVAGVVGGVIAAITSPLVLIIGAIALLATAWSQNWGGIQEKAQIAGEFISNVFTDYLIPALQKVVAAAAGVWRFFQFYIWPVLSAIGELVGAVLFKAFEALVGYFQNVTLPVLKFLWGGFIKIKDTFVGMLDQLAKVPGIAAGFEGLATAVEKVVGFIRGLAEKVRTLKLPDWLTPGSPTPFEQGLRGIAASLESLSTKAMVKFADVVINKVLALRGTWDEQWAAIVETLRTATTYMLEMMTAHTDQVYEMVMLFMTQLYEGWVTGWQKMLTALNAALAQIEAGVEGTMASIAATILSTLTDVAGSLADEDDPDSAYWQFRYLGQALMEAIGHGAYDREGYLKDKINRIIARILREITGSYTDSSSGATAASSSADKLAEAYKEGAASSAAAILAAMDTAMETSSTGAIASGSSSTVTQIHIYGGLSISGVDSPTDLFEQLQAYTTAT